jgi:hypothetical protein
LKYWDVHKYEQKFKKKPQKILPVGELLSTSKILYWVKNMNELESEDSNELTKKYP